MQSAFITPKKTLGQNFLHDKNVARNIVRLLAPHVEDTIVEIGPGLGALTTILAETGAHIFAIDIDERAVAVLHELKTSLHWENVTCIHANILRTELGSFVSRQHPVRIIGNLPYNITSQVLFWLFEQNELVHDFVFMVQKEMAERIVSNPGRKEYGILSVLCQVHCDLHIEFKVSPNVFFPRPDVWSAVIYGTMKTDSIIRIHDYSQFKNLVKGGFGQRRKTLHNSLKAAGFDTTSIPEEFCIQLQKRAEQLSLDEFISLSNAFSTHG